MIQPLVLHADISFSVFQRVEGLVCDDPQGYSKMNSIMFPGGVWTEIIVLR